MGIGRTEDEERLAYKLDEAGRDAHTKDGTKPLTEGTIRPIWITNRSIWRMTITMAVRTALQHRAGLEGAVRIWVQEVWYM